MRMIVRQCVSARCSLVKLRLLVSEKIWALGAGLPGDSFSSTANESGTMLVMLQHPRSRQTECVSPAKLITTLTW